MTRAHETLERITTSGVVAVVRANGPQPALDAIEALVAGGIGVIEVTMTIPDAFSVVERLVDEHSRDLVVGVGSLRRPDDADRARQAGASFLVSAHADEALASAMSATGLTMSIGAFTPTEVVRSVELGSHVVKLFPGSSGGPGHLSALRGPFPDIGIMPTGGVTPVNLHEWVRAGAVAIGVGGGLCPTHAIEDGEWEAITTNARRFVAAWADAQGGEQGP